MILAHWPALFACFAQAMLALLALRARDPLGAPLALFGADQEEQKQGRSLADQAELFEIIVDQADRLERLISTYQRIERLEPELARVDVGALVRDVVALQIQQAGRAEAHLTASAQQRNPCS